MILQTSPGAPLRGGLPLPGRVPGAGYRGRGAELLHGKGSQHQQPGRDRQRARQVGHPRLGKLFKP